MALTSAYLVAAKNLPAFLEALRGARAPEKLTLKFIEDLDFKSTNDRLFIPVLKGLGFIEDNGVPKQRYFDFLDDSRWQSVLADGIREAYEDIFRLNKKAHTLTRAELVGKLKSLTQGKYSDAIIGNMTKTFTELVKLANFDASPTPPIGEPLLENPPVSDVAISTAEGAERTTIPPAKGSHEHSMRHNRLIDAMTYRIEILLPASRDKAVYDAIFRSLKEHLL